MQHPLNVENQFYLKCLVKNSQKKTVRDLVISAKNSSLQVWMDTISA